MKKLIIGLFFLIPYVNIAQVKNYKLTDTIRELAGRISFEHMLCGVFFDLDKATLRPESFPVLDSAVAFMKANPRLIIKVENHTDSRSYSDSYHPKLTQVRAQKIVDYFISKGIPKDHLIAAGHGNTKPLITHEEIRLLKTKEEQEKACQKNRRTVLKIISMA